MEPIDQDALRARIEEKNAEFMAMKPWQRRVEIAKDVIKQLDLGAILAEHGTYLSGFKPGLARASGDVADGIVAECKVCGIGGLFVAAVKRCDALQLNDLVGRDRPRRMDMDKYLGAFFSKRQICMVENAFEGFGGQTVDMTVDDRVNSSEFNRLYWSDPTKCMRRIMKNIIRNRGSFRPELRPDL